LDHIKLIDAKISPGELLNQVSAYGSPLIYGTEVWFVYQGGANEVLIAGDHTRWEPYERMERMDGQELWVLRRTFPDNARIDYKLVVDGQWINDPLNRNVTQSGFGWNSTLIMPGYQSSFPKDYETDRRGGVFRNLDYYSHSLGKSMRYHLYFPYNAANYPPQHIIYGLDGGEYLDYGEIHRVADFMIAEGELPQTFMALIDPGDRTTEYTIYEPYRDYVINELMPFIETTYLGGQMGTIHRTAIGISWGGLTAVYFAVSTQGMFERVLSQSGSFWPKDWEIFQMIAGAPKLNIHFCLQTGTLGDTEEMNEMMAGVLQLKGYKPVYQKYPEGHSWGNWKGHLYEGLKALF